MTETTTEQQEQQPTEQSLAKRQETLAERAASLAKITNDDENVAAGQLFKTCNALKKDATDYFAAMKRPAQQTLNAIRDKEREALQAIESVKLALGNALRDYKRRQDEEAARVRRIAEEAARKASEEAALQAAIEREEQGDEQGANEALDAPPAVAVSMPAMPAPVRQAKGLGFRTYYSAEVVDAKKVNADYMIPDEKGINEVARAVKDNAKLQAIVGEGVRLVETEKPA